MDYPCDKCKELKKQGHPRPSCEQCGLVILTPENAFIWQLYCKYFHGLLIFSGFGSWSINTELLWKLCKENFIDRSDHLMILRRIQVLASELYKEEEKESDG